MKSLHGAIHIFTDKPEPVVKSIVRELQTQAECDFGSNACPASVIIQYPHAVSHFTHLGLSYDYIAKIQSKRRKAPVLVSIVGHMSGWGATEEALRLWWGYENSCIAHIETGSVGDDISFQEQGLDVAMEKLGFLLSKDSVLATSLGKEKPLRLAAALSNELNIYLGGVEMDDYLNHLNIRSKTDYFVIYEKTKF